MLFLRDDKFYAPFFTDPKTHFGKSDKLARSQDPFWKIRKIGPKNSFMKIDFQTSVKSDKKVCFAYIM